MQKLTTFMLGALAAMPAFCAPEVLNIQVGPRPYFLVDDMEDSPLKKRLGSQQCRNTPFKKTDFSIGHRGAALQFPEHTRAALRGRCTHGCRHRRMRRHVHEGQGTGVPPRAE